MLRLDMGGVVIAGSAWVEKNFGHCIVFADVRGCDAYPDEIITWSIATSPHYEIAELIAEWINEASTRGLKENRSS